MSVAPEIERRTLDEPVTRHRTAEELSWFPPPG